MLFDMAEMQFIDRVIAERLCSHGLCGGWVHRQSVLDKFDASICDDSMYIQNGIFFQRTETGFYAQLE